MPAVDGVFVSLAHALRKDVPPVVATEAAPEAPAAPAPEPLPDVEDLAREVRVFRARLADAFDAARDSLLREFACAVLGRELQLAPPDLAAIAARLLNDHPHAQPLRLRVAPDDVGALAAHRAVLPPVVADPELAPGDALLDLIDGAVDARLGVRLALLLEHRT